MNNKKGYKMNTPKQLDLFNDLPNKRVDTVRVGTTLKGFFHIACLVLINPANKRNGVNDKTFKMIMNLCEQIEKQGVLDMDQLGLLKENN
tara:strand:- start:29 stop:298 length:270 start_codon:yes stop_codon:yes gene_type:complete